MQLAGEFVAAGHRIAAVNVNANGKHIFHLGFGDLDSPYPYLLAVAQPETERILSDRIHQLGMEIERGVELVSLSQDSEKTTVELRDAHGNIERVRVDWVVGCDGPHSTVRRALDIPFEGHTFEQLFILADVHVESPFLDSEAYLFSDHGDVCAIFPMGNGRYRIVADNPPEELATRDPTLQECQDIVTKRIPEHVSLSDPVWTATFHVNSRMVSSLRSARVFLAGDSAHIHSPAGAQGMNTGMQDAVNLAWKLALVCRDHAPASLLDSYHAERYPVEQSVLRQTDALFSIAGASGGPRSFIRQHVLPLLGNTGFVQHKAARIVSEIAIDYENSPIVEDHHLPQGPRAGDRAPDALARLASNGTPARIADLCSRSQHTLLLIANTPDQVALAGAVSRNVAATCGELVVPFIIADADSPDPDVHGGASREANSAGASSSAHAPTRPTPPLRDEYGATHAAIYLVRPDGYIGFRAPLTRESRSLLEYLARLFALKPHAGH
jgi:2-polyprenyl-6-methoxyphenol hydroxylase-like FAD-dependent oxidoreductase